MSSWFKSSEEEDDQNQNPSTPPSVRDDLSVLGQTIGRQLRGVADFLAPPPLSTSTASTAVVAPVDDTSSEKFLGVKKDLVEIGGSFKTSLSLLSSNKAVTKISRFATNLLQLRHGNDDEEDDDDAVGITEDVVEFVVKISKRPELWTDFPLALGDGISHISSFCFNYMHFYFYTMFSVFICFHIYEYMIDVLLLYSLVLVYR